MGQQPYIGITRVRRALSKEPLTNRPLGDQHLVNVHQAKTHLSQLLQEVEQG